MASALGVGRDYRYESLSEPPYSCSVWTGAPTKPKASSLTGTSSKFDPWCENQGTKLNTATTTATPIQLSPFENSFVTEPEDDKKTKSSVDGGSPSSVKSVAWSDATEASKGYSLWNSESIKEGKAGNHEEYYYDSSSKRSAKAKSTASPVGSLSSGASASTSPKWTTPERKPKVKIDVTDPKHISDWVHAATKKENMISANVMSMVTTSGGLRGNQGKKKCSSQQKFKWDAALKNCNRTLTELLRVYQRMENGINIPFNSTLREYYDVEDVEVYYVIKQTIEMSSTLEPAISRLLQTSGEYKKFRGYGNSNPRKLASFQTAAGEALGNLATCSKFLYVMYPLVESLMEARYFDSTGNEELDTVISLVHHLDYLLEQILRSVSSAYREFPQDTSYKNNGNYFSGYQSVNNHGPRRSAYGYM